MGHAFDQNPEDHLRSDVESASAEALELPAVLAEVAGHAVSSPGRTEVLSIEPLDSRDEIEQLLGLVRELRESLSQDGALPLSALAPMEGVWEKLSNPATLLDLEEVFAVRDVVYLADRLSDRLMGYSRRFPSLWTMGTELRDTSHVGALIGRVFDEHGEVKSSASPQLSDIRNRLHAQKKRISKLLTEVVRDRALEDVVQEDYVSLRADRYVILLKPNFRGRLDGVVHDHSRSGASAYVEPLSVVEANNRVASLLDEEQGEILRIFKEVSDEIRNSGEDLEMNYALLARLDALQARARYAEETRSVAPELISEGFRIRGARHPLLLASGRDVVPMDVIQEPDTHVTVISGANMGGKTVALKIAGLFPLMARCGIMLPAREGSGIRCQGGIMADIGEEQDLLGQVSSFSSHMLRIRGILSAVRPGDLVLLDELGSATDPDEGSALAMAIIDELAARNARVVVTTHLSHLKAYALGRQDITNVSAHFDPETLQPSFRLVYDLPGESHALTTAERIGLPPDVIAAARAYADRSAGGSSQLMERLRNELMGVEQEREAATRMRKELEDRIARLESSKESILEEAGNEAQRVVKEAQKDILSLQKALKSGMPKRGDEPQQELARIRRNVERSLGRPLDRKDTAVGEGDRVRVEPLGREGVVTQMLDRDRAEIAVGNMRIRSDLKDLTVLPRSPRQKSSSKKDRIRVDMPLAVPRTEVNVIGFRVEEALPVVDKALDEALVSGLSSLLIIHGKGTGRLKQAIWDHLSDNPAVRGIAPGHHYGGGEGVSVVDLETG